MRVLILCAEVGEGHVTVARTLADSLRTRPEVEAVSLRTDLEVMGPRFGRFMSRGFDTHLEDAGWSYELAYRVFFQMAAPRRAAHLALAALGGRGLRQTIREHQADVVVTEYPVLSAALGQLRALGRVAVPVCSSISDPAGLYYWAHPGIDLHLLSWPDALAEVDRIAGPGKAAVVRPLIDPRFHAAPPRGEARTALGLPADGPVVLVSGGGWGLGDLSGAAERALQTIPGATVVVLSGRNARVQMALQADHAQHPAVRVLGFTDQMPALLSAADAIVHTTGGTTALEARVVGCPLINFGTGVAHVRAHARALAEQGVAEWARDGAALGPALERTLARARPAPLATDALPEAADLVLGVAAGHRPVA
ncbi:MAG TPA: glycosyltransferase [Solirubrobacteraceae bacterium]|jgi:UDP-N-acetylglucosamine:LPS N-acetylglucosamine transferase|nr:glycosyltransferase [Solirubrobacteraceae bacterium]